ncbi:protein kinase C delta type-like [Xenopus tropicalis]|uniref:Protein kinase C delta type-like n=1 Tax=Xenopus tropicalis TaxID=8364 RepID=A0A8J1JAL6_XENTR|nr:protein kinase C delta type-like [Xenopus tropicalis]
MEKECIDFDGSGPGAYDKAKRMSESEKAKGPGKKKGKKRHREEKSEGKTGRRWRDSDHFSEERPKIRKRTREDSSEQPKKNGKRIREDSPEEQPKKIMEGSPEEHPKKQEKRTREDSPEGESDRKRPRADPKGLNPLQLCNYTFYSVIGGGGYGTVMLASLKDRRSNVAVKILKKKPGSFSSIRAEANILRISGGSPYLCHGYAAFQTQRHAFLVMEYASGGTLKDQLRTHGALDMTRVEFHSAELVCGLQFLHDNGIIHRDLKPDNILLDQEGHIKISDFGMSQQNVFGNRTVTGRAGTLGYIAPEIFLNKAYNAAVDWWALGVIICEMATGESPFPEESDDENFIDGVISDEPNIPYWLSGDLKDLLRELLEKNPDRRLGVNGNIRHHPFFSAIEWEELEEQLTPLPFDLRAPSKEHIEPDEGKALSFLESPKNINASGDKMKIPGLSFISCNWQD